MVSHDRAFLDNVVTSTLVLEGGGRVGEYVGGYTDWVRQRAAVGAAALPVARPKGTVTAGASTRTEPASRASGSRKRKLSFKETTELASLPASIDALERERERVYASLADPALLRDGAAVAAAKARLAGIEREVAAQLARWEELETMAT